MPRDVTSPRPRFRQACRLVGAVCDLNLLAARQRVGWVEDYCVVRRQTRGNLYSSAGISANFHWNQLHTAIAHDADAETLGAEQKCIRRKHQTGGVCRNLEVDESVCAWKQLGFWIVDIDFDIQRAGGLVDGVGVARDGAFKSLSWILIERKGRFGSVLDRGGVGLRHGNIDAKFSDSCQ